MSGSRKQHTIYTAVLMLVAVLGITFVSTMGFLNYRSTAINLEVQVINRIEEDTVSDIETSLEFGKSFENYYGMDDMFSNMTSQFRGITPFVISSDGTLMYFMEQGRYDQSDIEKFLSSRDFTAGIASAKDDEPVNIKSGRTHVSMVPIHQDGAVAGYMACIYPESIFRNAFKDISRKVLFLDIVITLIVCCALYIYLNIEDDERHSSKHTPEDLKAIEKTATTVIIAAGVLVMSLSSMYVYQADYRGKIEESVKVSLKNLEAQIEDVRSTGIDLREAEGLREYIDKKIYSIDTLHAVRITERISEVRLTSEQTDLIIYEFGDTDGSGKLYLEAEISEKAIDHDMRDIILIMLSTMIILLIFVYELNTLVDLISHSASERYGDNRAFSEKRVSQALRFTGFLCSTAEYMCVPYAAMMIRAGGESLFGLSVGMTAALPLTLEGLMQMMGMIALPGAVKKLNVHKVFIYSAAVMVICNVTAFLSGRALAIILCRALAGFAYAGFKQVSNYLITSGYETEQGRSENISQDNAGLLAGATCGAGLGAILSANMGYGMTFLFSAVLFAVYLVVTLLVVPWKMLRRRNEGADENEILKFSDLKNLLTSPEILLFVAVLLIPLYIGVMLCVTLIPAICQTEGISSVILSYCYIANGIAGIYIGPSLVVKAKERFGLPASISFAFALTAVSIFILKLPPVAVMIIISSMILGFLDGFGTPAVTDRFMELKSVRNNLGESTALNLYILITYILLTFAPMIAELLLLPGHGALSPMMIGAAVYAAAAVIVLLTGRSSRE